MANELVKYRICDRCPDETLAVETHKLTLNGYRYEIDLCQEHAGELYVSVMDWANLGTLVGEPTIFDKPRAVSTAAAATQLPDAVRRATPTEPRHIGPMVADFADKWIFTEHARLRLDERQISEWDALRAAELPERTTRSQRDPDLRIHLRDRVKVVLNPHTHEIITVARPDDKVTPLKEKVTSGGN